MNPFGQVPSLEDGDFKLVRVAMALAWQLPIVKAQLLVCL